MVPLKAHISEHHFCDFSESCGGIGDFDAEFVEQYHQKEKTADAMFKVQGSRLQTWRRRVYVF
jgi:hypothetical protein